MSTNLYRICTNWYRIITNLIRIWYKFCTKFIEHKGQNSLLRELFTNPGSYGIGQYRLYGHIGHYGHMIQSAQLHI